MRKFVVITILLVLGGKYGFEYLFSDKFEAYADRTKEPLTCRFENFLGHTHVIMSNYEKGYYRFSHTLNRCPDTAMAEVAAFEIARCLEGMGKRLQAAAAYTAYIEKYPGTERAVIASRARDFLSSS